MLFLSESLPPVTEDYTSLRHGLSFSLCWWGNIALSQLRCSAPVGVKQRGLGDKGWWLIAERAQSFSLGGFWRRPGLGDLFCLLQTLTLLVPVRVWHTHLEQRGKSIF